MKYPACGAARYQTRDGKTASGSQRMRCSACTKRYTPQAKAQGYDHAIRAAALRMVADGVNLRRIERHLHVHHTTVLRPKRYAAERLPATPPQPQVVDEVELDELYTFVAAKKPILPDNSVEGCNADLRHYIAVLARKTRCVSRSEASLRDTIELFVAAYNRRQLQAFRFPHFRRPITDFVSP